MAGRDSCTIANQQGQSMAIRDKTIRRPFSIRRRHPLVELIGNIVGSCGTLWRIQRGETESPGRFWHHRAPNFDRGLASSPFPSPGLVWLMPGRARPSPGPSRLASLSVRRVYGEQESHLPEALFSGLGFKDGDKAADVGAC